MNNGAMSPPGGVRQELQQKRAQQAAEAQQMVDQELEGFRRSGRAGRKKPAKALYANNNPASPCKNGAASPTDVKARNTGLWVCICAPRGKDLWRSVEYTQIGFTM